VESRGWTPRQNSGYSSLVRALSSYSRAVVKYLPCEFTLLQKVQAIFEDAVFTADAEQHFDTVVEGYSGNKNGVNASAEPQDFVETVVRILKTKTKRLKQHSRRATARTTKGGKHVQQEVAKWPKELISEADDFRNWSQDIFMHIAILILSEHLAAKGMEVTVMDGIQDVYRRSDIKEQIQCHNGVLGVQSYAIQESKENALVAKANNSWDEFYDNLDYWLQKDSQGNYTRVCAL